MKKIIGLFVMAVMMVMMAVSCTPNGAPLSLVGVWKTETTYEGVSLSNIHYMEITDDDFYITASTKDGLETAKRVRETSGTKIVSATCNELHTRSVSVTSDNQYGVIKYELAGDKLTIDEGYHCVVYTKEK